MAGINAKAEELRNIMGEMKTFIEAEKEEVTDKLEEQTELIRSLEDKIAALGETDPEIQDIIDEAKSNLESIKGIVSTPVVEPPVEEEPAPAEEEPAEEPVEEEPIV